MAAITDKSGASFVLVTTGTKYSWGYLVTRNGASTGGGGVNLFVGNDGYAHVINEQGNEYYYNGSWKFLQKATPPATTNAGGNAPAPGQTTLNAATTSPGGNSQPLNGGSRSILDNISGNIEIGQKSSMFWIAGGILIVIIVIVVSVTGIFKKRKKR